MNNEIVFDDGDWDDDEPGFDALTPLGQEAIGWAHAWEIFDATRDVAQAVAGLSDKETFLFIPLAYWQLSGYAKELP